MKRWSKQPSESGLARVCQSKRGAVLKEEGRIIAQINSRAGDKRLHIGWYWVCKGKNTCNEPVETIEEAKAQVMAHLKTFEEQ